MRSSVARAHQLFGAAASVRSGFGGLGVTIGCAPGFEEVRLANGELRCVEKPPEGRLTAEFGPEQQFKSVSFRDSKGNVTKTAPDEWFGTKQIVEVLDKARAGGPQPQGPLTLESASVSGGGNTAVVIAAGLIGLSFLAVVLLAR